MNKRKYTKTRRAEQQAQTKQRIVKATVALHETLGPANTSIKAIAEKAGVQRLTVYRYFPDENSLFQACTSHWLALNPPPDIENWKNFTTIEQTHEVLLAFFNYYRDTETMWRSAYRDIDEVAALKTVMIDFELYIDNVRNRILPPWKLRGKKKQQLSATLRHCLRFSTWSSLNNEKLNDRQITELVMRWLMGIANKD